MKANRDLIECKRDIIIFRQKSIEENLSTLKRNGKMLRIGAFCGLTAPVVGGITSVATIIAKHIHWTWT